MGRHRPEGLDLRRAALQVVHVGRAHGLRRAQAQGVDLLPDGHGAARRAGASAGPDHGRARVQRAVHRGRADLGRERPGRRRQWLARRADHADERALRPGLLPPGPAAPAPGRAHRGGRRARPARRSGRRRQARLPAHEGRDPAPDRLPRPDDDREVRDARPGGFADQVDVVGDQPGARAVRGRPARRRRADQRQPLGLRAAALARQHHRGRHDRDPQEHRRGARARAAAAEGSDGMNFDFSEDQHEIKRTARDLLASRSSFAKVREAAESKAYDPTLWSELVELGWPGIAIAEEHGGQGLGAVELAILCEELGYALAASPFLSTVLAAEALGAGGSAEQQARWLPGLASGEITGALGTAGGLVGDAAEAAVIVLIGEDGVARVIAREDAEVSDVDSIDPTRRAARVSADGEPLGGDEPQAGIDRATVAVAAELVGVSQRALEMTLAYVKDRKQFDTPVGAYQAVSHKCAQMLKDTEGARSATYYAAWAADAGADGPGLPEPASLAKAAASD